MAAFTPAATLAAGFGSYDDDDEEDEDLELAGNETESF